MAEAHPFTSIVPQPVGGPWTLVPLPDGFAVPQHFTAEGETVCLEVEVGADGNPYCRTLEVRAPEGASVTADSLRRIAVGRLVRQAVAAAARKYTPVEEGGEPVFQFVSTPPEEAVAVYERDVKSPRRPRRGSPITDENLHQVAELYRAALERGDPPTQTVADQMEVPRSTAARWVAEARKRNLLGPALRGRAGERGETT
jgi:hypothetical protein